MRGPWPDLAAVGIGVWLLIVVLGYTLLLVRWS